MAPNGLVGRIGWSGMLALIGFVIGAPIGALVWASKHADDGSAWLVPALVVFVSIPLYCATLFVLGPLLRWLHRVLAEWQYGDVVAVIGTKDAVQRYKFNRWLWINCGFFFICLAGPGLIASAPVGWIVADVEAAASARREIEWQKHKQLLLADLHTNSSVQDTSVRPTDARSAEDGEPVSIPPGTPVANANEVELSDSISPAVADLSSIGSMEVRDTDYISRNCYMFEGRGEYERVGSRSRNSVVVKGIWSPTGTRVVRLDISRGQSSLDVWNDRSTVRQDAGPGAKLALVDDLGRFYFPIGYIHATAGGDRTVEISLARAGNYADIDTFPNLSKSGADRLFAIFTPAIGRKIVGIKLGAEWVARADLDIAAPS